MGAVKAEARKIRMPTAERRGKEARRKWVEEKEEKKEKEDNNRSEENSRGVRDLEWRKRS